MNTRIAQLAPFALALVAACGICAVLILVLGDNPLYIFGILFHGAFGSATGIGYTLFYATPLIFTGLAVSIAMWGGLFNIGGEGQLYVGAFAVTWIGVEMAGLPAVGLVPLCILAGVVGGACWGGIAGYLRAHFGAHEVITTIMLNFIAVGLVGLMISGPYHMPGDQIPQTMPIGDTAVLPRVAVLIPGMPASVPLNITFGIALIVAAWVWYLDRRTRFGLELRAVGQNPVAARALGINVPLVLTISMAVAGGVAGLVGVNEVMGFRHRLLSNFSPGFGFVGIAVALLGRNHPVGIILAAIFFGALMRGGLLVDIFSEHITKNVVGVFQGVIILAVVVEAFWRRVLGAKRS